MFFRFVAVLCFFVYLNFASASPSPNAVVARQASVTVPTALASPTSITTTNTVQTANGTMTETCVITFTPAGQQVQEIRNCTLAAEAAQATTTVIAASSTASPMVAAAFVMPGTTIQVLPIGLGIYGGITSVALFAVVFVTWERVQYRKDFRQQRLTENKLMGYVG